MQNESNSKPSTSTSLQWRRDVDTLLDMIRNPRDRFDEDNWWNVTDHVLMMDNKYGRDHGR